jgi:glycosyltransferase involved in cell wall biosynthesis
MKILLVHNRYVQRGGEDAVFDQERDLLRAGGQEVEEYVRENSEIGARSSIGLGLSATWSFDAYEDIQRILTRFQPDIVHVHNTLPLISPSVYYSAARAGVPVVQTLHNYRLLCANGLLMRNAATCEDCVGKAIGWPAVRHRCYRGSLGASLAVVASNATHRLLGTWRRKVGLFIALCEFSRSKLLQAGLPTDAVVVRPNFTADLDGDAGAQRAGALYLGRLSSEKGVGLLLEAWRELLVPLKVIGTGELEPAVRASAELGHLQLLGYVSQEVRDLALSTASFVVMPSLVYEGFPMVVAESYSAGTPIIGSRLGALAELIEDGVTGLHFEPGSADDLARKVRWAYENPQKMAEMGRRARQRYEERYTADVGYRRLMQIYDQAIDESRTAR